MSQDASTGLSFKTPLPRNLFLAIAVATGLHGLIWLVVQSILGLGFADAMAEAQKQAFLCLTWLIASLSLWGLRLPSSRFKATLNVLGTAGFVTVLGSIAGYLRLIWSQGNVVTGKSVISFLMFSVAMSLAHLILAIPSAIAFRSLSLTTAQAPTPPQ
jgi:hypothetical protein